MANLVWPVDTRRPWLTPLSGSKDRYADTRPDMTAGKPDLSERGEIYYSGSRIQTALETYYQNPDDVIRKRGFAALRDMGKKNGYLKGMERTRIQAVVRRGWDITPASEEQADVDIAAFVRWALEGMTGAFGEVLEVGMDARRYGYAIAEKVWRRADYNGRDVVVPQTIKAKQQEYIEFALDNYGNILKVVQRIPGRTAGRGVELPADKMIVFTSDADPGNPYGNGWRSDVFWHDWFMRENWKQWAYRNERFGSPHAILTVPERMDATAREGALDYIRAMRNDTGFAIPNDMKLEFLDAVSDGGATYERFLKAQESAIAIAILGQTLTTDIGDVGSKAAATVHKGVQNDITDSDCEWLYARLNDVGGLIPQLIGFNFPDARMPILAPLVQEDTDLESFARIVSALVSAGLPIGTEYIYKKFGITVPAPGVETLSAPFAIAPGGIPGGGTGDSSHVGHGGEHTGHGLGDQFADDPDFWRAPNQYEDGPTLRHMAREIRRTIAASIADAVPVWERVRDDLVKQGAAALDAKNMRAELRVNLGGFETILYRQTLLGAMIGRDTAVREIRKAGGVVEPAKFADDFELPDDDAIYKDFATRVPMTRTEWSTITADARARAFFVTTTQGQEATKVVYNRLLEAIGNGLSQADFRRNVIADFGAWTGNPFGLATEAAVESRLNTVFRTNVMTAINNGRMDIYERPMSDPVEALQYSAILDDRTTELCRKLDGKIFAKDSDAWARLRPPNHYNCRSVLTPILRSQAAKMDPGTVSRKLPLINGEPAAPAAGFGKQSFGACGHDHGEGG